MGCPTGGAARCDDPSARPRRSAPRSAMSVAAAGAGGCRSGRPPRRHASRAVAERRSRRGDVEEPPAVRDELPVVQRRPGVEDERARRLGLVDARRSACRGQRRAGSRPPSTTTVTAPPRRAAERDAGERSPPPPRRARVSRSPSTRGSTDCVSGSPKRQLYSSTRGPSGVSISPTKSDPTNGAPRRASSASTGRRHVSTQLLERVVVELRHGRVRPHAARVRPLVAVVGALEVARRRKRDRVRARRRGRGPTPRAPRAAPRRESGRRTSRATSRPARELRVRPADDDALARGEPVGLDHARRARRVEQAPRGGDARRLHHVLRERLRALDPRRRAPRPEHRDPGVPQRRRRHRRRAAPPARRRRGRSPSDAREPEQRLAVVVARPDDTWRAPRCRGSRAPRGAR